MLILKRLDVSFADELCKIDNECMPVPWTAAMFFNELDNDKTYYVGAFDGEKIVGYGGMWLVADEAQITNIAVLPQYRKRGLGDGIVKNLLENAKNAAAFLEVRESNDSAVRLYEKNGFVKDGIRKNYYKNPTENAVLMSKRD